MDISEEIIILKNIRILICDYSKDYIEIIKDIIFKHNDIEICGIVREGNECLRLIKTLKPDVLLIDVVMPMLDGFDVTEIIKNDDSIKSKIILMSTYSSDYITALAKSFNADYFFLKPLREKPLIDRIRDLGDENFFKIRNNKSLISALLLRLFIPINTLGFKYIIDAVLLLINSNTSLSVTKEIYTHIAKVYDTTVLCVEKGIRNSVFLAYNKNSEIFLQILGTDCKPSNKVLINLLAEKIISENN